MTTQDLIDELAERSRHAIDQHSAAVESGDPRRIRESARRARAIANAHWQLVQDNNNNRAAQRWLAQHGLAEVPE